MSLVLDPPSQLFFERPLTISATEKLTLTNNEDKPMAFKIKTTSPKQYCVRPNSGRVEPNEKLEVQILLQPFKDEPPSDFKCKDKFLVQYALIPPDKLDLPNGQIWSALEAENKSSISERKLRCVFLPPSDGTESDNKPIEPATPSPVKSAPPLMVDENKLKAKKSKETIRETTLSPDQLTSVKDALQQAQAIKIQLEKEVSNVQTKIQQAENKPSGSNSKLGNDVSDLQVQAMGGIAVVSFLLGAWLL